jgi:hypothetical protein
MAFACQDAVRYWLFCWRAVSRCHDENEQPLASCLVRFYEAVIRFVLHATERHSINRCGYLFLNELRGGVYVWWNGKGWGASTSKVFDRLVWNLKLKVELSLCLTKHHILKTYLGEWRYSSTHSRPRLKMEVSVELHAPAVLLSGKELLVPIG